MIEDIFFESYNKDVFQHAGIDKEFIQDNQSFSTYGTIRSLHAQQGVHSQAKLALAWVRELLL